MQLSDYLSTQNLSREEFATRIGVTAEAVRLYLAGRRTPSYLTMQAIIAATKGAVRPNDFFGDMVVDNRKKARAITR